MHRPSRPGEYTAARRPVLSNTGKPLRATTVRANLSRTDLRDSRRSWCQMTPGRDAGDTAASQMAQ